MVAIVPSDVYVRHMMHYHTIHGYGNGIQNQMYPTEHTVNPRIVPPIYRRILSCSRNKWYMIFYHKTQGDLQITVLHVCLEKDAPSPMEQYSILSSIRKTLPSLGHTVPVRVVTCPKVVYQLSKYEMVDCQHNEDYKLHFKGWPNLEQQHLERHIQCH